MTTQTIISETTAQAETVEQSFLNIVRTLPDERILQLLDFAQVLELQSSKSGEQHLAEFGDIAIAVSAVTPPVGDREWHHFIEQSYGCLADDPIERSVQG